MRPVVAAVLICLAAAALEGICAGADVRRRLQTLRQPAWSPRIRVWVVIGALYYVACGVIAYRLLSLDLTELGVRVALALLVLVLVINALWNLTFFRAQDLRLSVQIAAAYAVLAVALAAALFRVDRTAGWVWVPYLIYLIIGTRWVVLVRRLNVGSPVA